MKNVIFSNIFSDSTRLLCLRDQNLVQNTLKKAGPKQSLNCERLLKITLVSIKGAEDTLYLQLV